ncbi:MAG: ATP-dependent DNA helicase RecG [Microbacteriaceae bacterium]
MTFQLDDKISGIIGGKTAAALKRAFGIETVEDLLKHYPRRYLKRGELSPIADLPLGEQVTIVAQVRSVRKREMQKRRGDILEVVISDGEGLLTLTFFNQGWRAIPGRPESIIVGDRGLFSGKISSFRGNLQLAHPEYELFDKDPVADDTSVAEPSAGTFAQGVQEIRVKHGQSIDPEIWATQPVPVYPATAQLTSWNIAQAVRLVLDGLAPLPELIPADLAVDEQLLGYRKALELIHQPIEDSDWRQARRTLAFMEAFVLQLSLLRRKLELRALASLSRTAHDGGFLERFAKTLPFELTPDQRTVSAEISRDLAESYPMNRLLHGEVGSGKTLVALLAMLTVADSDGQSAMLVPTEVLAVQHFRSIQKLLGEELSAVLQPTLLTGQMSAAERRKALLAIASGSAKIVVGTHALIAEKTQFYDLGLVIIDEQHRFGVDQREQLRAKGTNPNLLVLSATPIPRTVAMTIFGDLEVSTIKTMPAKRAGITSHLVPLAQKPAWRERIWERLKEEVLSGRQVFVVTPAINAPVPESDSVTEQSTKSREKAEEEGEWLDEQGGSKIASIEESYEFLSTLPLLRGINIGVLHGQLSTEDKDLVMRAFTAGEIQVLLATTVIEVGVDVPNASLMIVLSADRFGVSQLHQLRGRIGRGEHPGLALFVTEAAEGSLAMERLAAVTATTDGFELAQLDLELRNEGDVLGSRQSGGQSSLKLLRVTRDTELILAARGGVEAILAADPELHAHTELAKVLGRINEERANYLQKS